MKHAALLAAGLVAAVLLIQGTGSTISVPGSSVGGITFASGTSGATRTSSATTGSTASVPLTLSATGAQSTPATSKSTAAHQSSAPNGSASATVRSSGAAAVATTATRPHVHTLISGWNSGGSTPPTSTCPSAITGSTAGAPDATSIDNIPGTTSDDLASFATAYNAIRVENCLPPVPFANIRYDSCLEQRLFWMADDPSTNPLSAWGHTGTARRSDGVRIVGCDGDIAIANGYTGATVAQAWWNSTDHRASLYQPADHGSTANVCIHFAMTHGGYNQPSPNEPYSYTRAAAIWTTC